MDSIAWTLELIRFVPLILIMGYAAYSDYKTGEVSNKLWRYAIVGGILTAIENAVFFSIPLLAINSIFICGTILFAFLIYLLGGSGGADSKALITLGVSAPLVPLWSFLWPVPLPFFAFLIGSILALPFLLTKKTKASFWKRPIRFLPFVFIGLLIAVIL